MHLLFFFQPWSRWKKGNKKGGIKQQKRVREGEEEALCDNPVRGWESSSGEMQHGAEMLSLLQPDEIWEYV